VSTKSACRPWGYKGVENDGRGPAEGRSRMTAGEGGHRGKEKSTEKSSKLPSTGNKLYAKKSMRIRRSKGREGEILQKKGQKVRCESKINRCFVGFFLIQQRSHKGDGKIRVKEKSYGAGRSHLRTGGEELKGQMGPFWLPGWCYMTGYSQFKRANGHGLRNGAQVKGNRTCEKMTGQGKKLLALLILKATEKRGDFHGVIRGIDGPGSSASNSYMPLWKLYSGIIKSLCKTRAAARKQKNSRRGKTGERG